MTIQKINRYTILSQIGLGGMATVYLAYDPNFDRKVAIKILPREFQHDPQFRARFQKEAKAIAALEHPAIVPVYDYGEDQGQPYLVMRYMAGGSLADRLLRGPLHLIEAAYILSKLSSALDEAHGKGFIHRDLKPGNILFDQRNQPYISDFGIVKITQETTSLTGGRIVGTPAYMSPEQGLGKGLDGRSDLYSMGAILFEMLTGKIPYEADTPTGQIMRHIVEPVPNILQVAPGLPPNCQRVIEKSMAKVPDERYQTMYEMSDELEEISAEAARVLPPSIVAEGSPSVTEKPIRPPNKPELETLPPLITPTFFGEENEGALPVKQVIEEPASAGSAPNIEEENRVNAHKVTPILEKPTLQLESATHPERKKVKLPLWIFAGTGIMMVFLVIFLVFWSQFGGTAKSPTATPIQTHLVVAVRNTPMPGTATSVPTLSVSDTPTSTPVPNIPIAIASLFISTITPNPDAIFSPLQFANALDDNFLPIKPGSVFQNPVGHIYAQFTYDQMVSGSQWTALWYRGTEIIYYETKPWDGATGGIGYTDWNPEPSEWLPGEYVVQIFVGNIWKISGSFTVKGQPPTASQNPSTTPTLINTPTQTLSIPTATRTLRPPTQPPPQPPTNTPVPPVVPTDTREPPPPPPPTHTPAPP